MELNGKITRTFLGFEVHGILTFVIDIENRFGTISFGTLNLDHDSVNLSGMIRGLLETVEAKGWEELDGLFVRIELERATGPVTAIGHIVKDKWWRLEG